VLIDEYIGLVPIQNRRIYFQPFSMTLRTREGLWDESLFVSQIEEQAFSMIVIFSEWGHDRIAIMWTDAVLKAIDDHYVLRDEIAGNQIFEPRRSE
jgi:hypothetical protein